MSFFDDLKRRNVFRVGVAYAAVGWLLVQVADVVFPFFGAPDWVLHILVVLLLLGLPVTLVFAWVFELTPEGVKREKDVDRSASITHSTGRKLDRVIIVVLVLALGYFIWERQARIEPAEPVVQPVPETNTPVEDAAPNKRSIAVLPLANLSTDPEQEFFADGMTEALIIDLTKIGDLKVISRNSAMCFKGTDKPLPAIASELDDSIHPIVAIENH